MRKSGVTMIELLIALIIVGIMASLTVGGFSKAIEKTRGREAWAGIQQLHAAEKAYFAQYDQFYPVSQVSGSRSIPQLKIDLAQEHWVFKVETSSVNGVENQQYTITATRTQGTYANQTLTMTDNGTKGGNWFYR